MHDMGSQGSGMGREHTLTRSGVLGIFGPGQRLIRGEGYDGGFENFRRKINENANLLKFPKFS